MKKKTWHYDVAKKHAGRVFGYPVNSVRTSMPSVYYFRGRSGEGFVFPATPQIMKNFPEEDRKSGEVKLHQLLYDFNREISVAGIITDRDYMKSKIGVHLKHDSLR